MLLTPKVCTACDYHSVCPMSLAWDYPHVKSLKAKETQFSNCNDYKHFVLLKSQNSGRFSESASFSMPL